MSTNDTAQRRRGTVTPASGGLGFFGLLSFVGALVYFWGAATSLGGWFLAILQALVWPAYLVYGLLKVTLG